LERLTLSVLNRRLLTAEHAKIFAEEFKKEAMRLAAITPEVDPGLSERLQELEIALDNLAQNMLAGVISSTLSLLLTKLEAEREEIRVRMAASARRTPIAPVLADSDLLQRFEEKIGHLVDALGDEAIRQEATTFASGALQRIALKIEALLPGRYSHVPDQHGRFSAPRINLLPAGFAGYRFLDGLIGKFDTCSAFRTDDRCRHIKRRFAGKKNFRRGYQATCRFATYRQSSVPRAGENDDGRQSPVSNYVGGAVRTDGRNFGRSSLFTDRSHRV
jgi:hypothetical protein